MARAWKTGARACAGMSAIAFCSATRGSGPRQRVPGLGASGCVALQEAGEVAHVQDRRHGAVVAVGVRIGRGVALEEAGEVLDVQDGGGGALVAVGVAG